MDPGAPDEFVQLGDVRVAWADVQALLVALTNRRPLTAGQARVARAIVGAWADSAAWKHPPRKGKRPDPPLRAKAPAVLFAGGPLAGVVLVIESARELVCGLHAGELLQHLDAQAKLRGHRSCLPYVRDEAAPPDAARVLYRFAPDRALQAEDDCLQRASGERLSARRACATATHQRRGTKRIGACAPDSFNRGGSRCLSGAMHLWLADKAQEFPDHHYVVYRETPAPATTATARCVPPRSVA